MADSESSDVLANLPAGRPARRSSRRASADAAGESSPARVTAAKKPAAKKAAAKKPAAKKAAAKKAAAKPAAAKKAAASKQPAKAAAKKPAAATRKPAAKKAAAKRAAAKRAPAQPKPVSVAATTAGETAAHAPQRRSRIATPPEGRRADYGGAATHRARRVTTNRPWLPASGFVLPEEKVPNQLTSALGGLGSALADVARLSVGIATSLTVRRREIDAPEVTELTED